eukprot:1160057-Pelagomonas_calceolata.AAC.2
MPTTPWPTQNTYWSTPKRSVLGPPPAPAACSRLRWFGGRPPLKQLSGAGVHTQHLHLCWKALNLQNTQGTGRLGCALQSKMPLHTYAGSIVPSRFYACVFVSACVHAHVNLQCEEEGVGTLAAPAHIFWSPNCLDAALEMQEIPRSVLMRCVGGATGRRNKHNPRVASSCQGIGDGSNRSMAAKLTGADVESGNHAPG